MAYSSDWYLCTFDSISVLIFDDAFDTLMSLSNNKTGQVICKQTDTHLCSAIVPRTQMPICQQEHLNMDSIVTHCLHKFDQSLMVFMPAG